MATAKVEKNEEFFIIKVIASMCGTEIETVDPFKLAALFGVKKTTVEPWVRDIKNKVKVINKEFIDKEMLDKHGMVYREKVDEGRKKKGAAKKDEDDETVLHGTKSGKVTKPKGEHKGKTLLKAEGSDNDDDADAGA
ncbi:Hypothetical protein D9617_33g038340 [Elsinoe fawcettii]|nr:Hypothetical protein D9617_33g038340 [Elsinoe fawcettii]